jgi:hypothetical protein
MRPTPWAAARSRCGRQAEVPGVAAALVKRRASSKRAVKLPTAARCCGRTLALSPAQRLSQKRGGPRRLLSLAP